MRYRSPLCPVLPGLVLLGAAALACGPPPAEQPFAVEPEPVAEVEAVSLLGDDLTRPSLPPEFVAEQEALLDEARASLEAAPGDPDSLIWVGRRTAYLGRYREAIEIFEQGISQHPDYAPLYRHRGHRFITTRQLEAAIQDLERAAALVEGQPDVVEPDGLPNERGIPTSTLQTNIFYHLGLAHYLRGDFESALEAYRRCLELSANPDMSVATRHWLYMTLRRLGRRDRAAEVLEPVSAEMDIIENHDYHRLLLLYKGELDPEVLGEEIGADGDTLASATLGYGLGNWHLYSPHGSGLHGDTARAFEIFERIVAGEQWAAFGYLAAEAELARADDSQRDILVWRSERYRRLAASDGWLSLIALFPLGAGSSTFGSISEAAEKMLHGYVGH